MRNTLAGISASTAQCADRMTPQGPLPIRSSEIHHTASMRAEDVQELFPLSSKRTDRSSRRSEKESYLRTIDRLCHNCVHGNVPAERDR